MSVEMSQNEQFNGFDGAVAGLLLSDVIQLKGQNRFTGCIAVDYRELQGNIFFRDGEIVHAEQGDISGEAAVYEIITWPGGKFSIQPKIATTIRTINRSLGFLLLEAHRLMDEERAGRATESVGKGVAAVKGKRRHRSSVAQRLVLIPGVADAVLLRFDGTPVEDESTEAAALAQRGVALAAVGSRLGELFSVGEVKSAAVQATRDQMLLFEAKNHFIALSVKGNSQLHQVETDIRKTFATKK